MMAPPPRAAGVPTATSRAHRTQRSASFAARTVDRLAIALSAALLLATAACGGADPAEKHAGSGMGPEPWGPSSYMDKARGLWDLATEQKKAAFRDPKTMRPSTTAGDPRLYEKACGVRFTLADGTLPEWSDAPDGTKLSHLAKGFPDGTYYDWLRSDPKRWGAFNAWLLDPAIVKAAAAPGQSAADLVRGGAVGSTSGCPDASARVARLLAKKPAP